MAVKNEYTYCRLVKGGADITSYESIGVYMGGEEQYGNQSDYSEWDDSADTGCLCRIRRRSTTIRQMPDQGNLFTQEVKQEHQKSKTSRSFRGKSHNSKEERL